MEKNVRKTTNFQSNLKPCGDLEITEAHISLGNKTWAVGQIKQVMTQKAGAFFLGGISIIILFLAIVVIIDTPPETGGGVFFVLMVFVVFGFIIRASWIKSQTTLVWIKTGLIPVIIFQSTDQAEAESVKSSVERAIKEHTPS